MPNYKQKKKRLKQLVKQEEEERIQKIKQEGHQFEDTDAFKRSEKFYKYYVHRETDFSKVLNLQQLKMIKILGKEVYEIPQPKGAYLVKGFCNINEQIQVGYEALNRYIYRPYRTNLDGTNGLYAKEEGQEEDLKENEEVKPEEVKDENQNILYYFNEKIRMANLGYQYDWPHRSYPSTKVPVPATIDKLTKKAVFLFNQLTNQELQYRGEAVIVNYYKEKDYMTGHLDDGEIDQINPIFSFCFGLSCVFLLGGPTRETAPVAVKLEAGDLMIMSGYSRVCYHGVPRIIENSYKLGKQEIQLEKGELNGEDEVINYYKKHRLNVNIRQVYPNEKKQQKQ